MPFRFWLKKKKKRQLKRQTAMPDQATYSSGLVLYQVYHRAKETGKPTLQGVLWITQPAGGHQETCKKLC